MLKPKHTLQSVAKDLADGLRDGTIELNKRPAAELSNLDELVLEHVDVTISAKVGDLSSTRTTGDWVAIAWRAGNVLPLGEARIAVSIPRKIAVQR